VSNTKHDKMPRQLGLALAEPGIPPVDGYFLTLAGARAIGRQHEALAQFLNERQAAGMVNRTDAQTIWRGVMREWSTPFDVDF